MQRDVQLMHVSKDYMCQGILLDKTNTDEALNPFSMHELLDDGKD